MQKREQIEGRRICPEDFAEKFCESRRVVDQMKAEFKEKITVTLIQKHIDGTNKFFFKSIQRIEDYIFEKYCVEELLDRIVYI